MVGTSFEVMSQSLPSLSTTTAGPCTSGRQTRPTNVPREKSPAVTRRSSIILVEVVTRKRPMGTDHRT